MFVILSVRAVFLFASRYRFCRHPFRCGEIWTPPEAFRGQVSFPQADPGMSFLLLAGHVDSTAPCAFVEAMVIGPSFLVVMEFLLRQSACLLGRDSFRERNLGVLSVRHPSPRLERAALCAMSSSSHIGNPVGDASPPCRHRTASLLGFFPGRSRVQDRKIIHHPSTETFFFLAGEGRIGLSDFFF